jgi:hypothetical protein
MLYSQQPQIIIFIGRSHCVAQAVLELAVLLLHPPGAGITDVHHDAWFQPQLLTAYTLSVCIKSL